MEGIAETLVDSHLIPYGKSWLIRMGILDLLHGRNQIFQFSKEQKAELPGDVQSLVRALTDLKKGKVEVDVGESGTLLHCLLFISAAAQEKRTFIRHGSLLKREITEDPKIVRMPAEELGKLDGGTSQWQTASYLFYSSFALGVRKIENPPEMLKLTYLAVEHYKSQIDKGQSWEPRIDQTLLRQAVAIVEMLECGKTSFVPQHSEDFCLARALGLISTEEGKKLFPSEANHETNRFLEIERVIADVESGNAIRSKDHRPIYSGVALQLIRGKEIKVKYPQKVAKSWPQFWRFVEFINKNRVG